MILGFPALQRVGLRSGLLAFYKLSDTSDSSGRGNTLTNNGGVTFVAGKIGNAAEFDGSNYLSTDITQDFGTQFTVSCWLNVSDSDSNRPAVSQWQTGEGAFFIGVVDDEYVFATGHDVDVNNPTWLIDGPAELDEWVHLVGVYFGNSERLYVNGSMAASQSVGPIIDPSAGIFQIGTLDVGNEFFFDGKIDAVGIWNRALSEAEVSALYNNGTGRELP